MHPTLTTRTLASILAAAVLLLGCAASTANAELEPWDQEKVSALGAELAEAIQAVRQAARNEPTLSDRSNTSGRSTQQYLDTLRQLEQSTRQLATRLGEGQNREQTLALGRRIGSLIRDAQETGRRLMLTKPSFDAIDAAIAVIEQLSPFYTERDPLLPRATQR